MSADVIISCCMCVKWCGGFYRFSKGEVRFVTKVLDISTGLMVGCKQLTWVFECLLARRITIF